MYVNVPYFTVVHQLLSLLTKVPYQTLHALD